MDKKIKIDNETNELNCMLGGYFSYGGKINICNYKMKGRKTRFYDLKILVYFDNLKDANLFKDNWGGGVCDDTLRNKKYPKKIKFKKNIYWRLYSSDTGYFLRAIQPYLIGNLTKKRVKLALRFHNYKQKHIQQQSEAYRKQKHKYYLQMRRLR